METEKIKCPKCGHRFDASESLRNRVENELKSEHEKEVKAAQDKAAAEVRQELVAQIEDANTKVKHAQDEAEEAREKAKKAQEEEMALRKEKRKLEERGREIDLEVARKADAQFKEREQAMQASFKEQLAHAEKSANESAAKKQALKLRERDSHIERLQKDVERLNRRAQLGSQEAQGEALEITLQESLERQFPQDRIEPVPRGRRGADILQHVQNHGVSCGSIIWEAKNAKIWRTDWVDKLKDDQRNAKAQLPILVSTILPDGVSRIGRINGVWVADVNSWPELAMVLREHLVELSYAQAASKGKGEKMSELYEYLVSDEFRQRVTAIVEAFQGVLSQVDRERRAMQKHWSEREKLAHRAITGASSIHGTIRGIVGGALPDIPSLEMKEQSSPENGGKD